MLTPERLRDLLRYDSETGVWTWKIALRRGWVDRTAGSTHKSGSLTIRIEGRGYRAHRLACLYVTGRWPAGQIDHKDGDPGNNRWHNLREATQHQNNGNQKRRPDNTSGLKGVSWHRLRQKWRSYISVNGRQIHLGSFDTKEAAHAAYCAAAREAFGEFARFH
jgi:hypothetical protein